jgi:S-adenosylmethionine decarboxylase
MDRPGPATTTSILNAEDAASRPEFQTGTEWLVDAAGCDPRLLADLAQLQRTCDAIVAGLKLRVIGEPQWHHFPTCRASAAPGGVTGLYLLAESHLTCHTFPEEGKAAFNLYCCRARQAWDWSSFLRERLGATHVVVRTVVRGSAATHESTEERP